MKRIVLAFLISFFGVGIINAQSPDMFSYQAVARDDQGNVLSNQDVGIKISILQGSATGTVVYEEEHSKTTNAQGLVNLMIGNGSVLSGTFSNINWSSGPYFVKVELDETGGTSYSTMGTSQLLSVPYAKYAESSANTFSGDYQDLANKPDLSDTASYDDYWMNQGDTVYTMNKIGIGTDSTQGNLTVQGTSTIPADEEITIRDVYPVLDLDNSGSGVSGVTFSTKGKKKGGFYYYSGYYFLTFNKTTQFAIDTTGQVYVNRAISVDSTTKNPKPKRVYGNSMPLAYGVVGVQGNLFGSYGIDSVKETSTGEYTVWIKNSYDDYPTVSINAFSSADPVISRHYATSGGRSIEVYMDDLNGNPVNSAFSIVVYGLPQVSKKKSAPKMNRNSGIGAPKD
jgi:hypothetical protein